MRHDASATESDNLDLRKKALMIGLSPFMSPDECVEAVRQWERSFSDKPRFALQEYVKQLVTPQDSLWPYRKDLFLNITKAMALPAREIEARYGHLFQADLDLDDKQAEAGTTDRVAQPIFEQVFAQLMQRLVIEDPGVAVRLRKFLREKMLQGEAFSMETQRLNSWLLGIKPDLEMALSLTQMRQIVHHAYVGSCEYLGPVRADQLLGEAIMEVEKKTRGEGFSPRALL